MTMKTKKKKEKETLNRMRHERMQRVKMCDSRNVKHIPCSVCGSSPINCIKCAPLVTAFMANVVWNTMTKTYIKKRKACGG